MLQQSLGHAKAADQAALALDEHRPLPVEALQGLPQAGLELLLRRLRCIRMGAQHRAPVFGQRLQVQHLRAMGGQGLQQPALAAACLAADQAQFEVGAGSLQFTHHAPAELAVATL